MKSGIILGFVLFIVSKLVDRAACTKITTVKVESQPVIACLKTYISCRLSASDAYVWWTLNGYNVTQSLDFAFHHNQSENRWTMEIKCPQKSHSGNVTCHAILPSKPDSYNNMSAPLVVYSLVHDGYLKTEPYVVVKPHAEVVLNCTVVLPPNADNILVSQPAWFDNNQRLDNTFVSVNGQNEQVIHLVIRSVTPNKAGLYTCRTEPSFSGRILMANTVLLTTEMLTPSKLDVQMLREEPPYSVMLKWQPTTLPSALSEAEFEQNLTITLYKVVMGFDNQFVEREITPENTKLEIWKTPVMVWWNLTDENIYTFTVTTCLSNKICGVPSKPFTLVLYKDFPRPENVSITCHYDNISFESFITAVWSPPPHGELADLTYNVAIAESALFRNAQGNMIVVTEHPTYVVSANQWRQLVKSNTNYTVQVCVVTAFGCGRYSLETQFTSCSTPPSVPNELPPFKLQNMQSPDNSVVLKLDLQRITERHGPIRCYRVILYKMRASQNGLPVSSSVKITTYEEVHQEGSYGAYVAEAFNSEHFKSEVTLGDEQQSNCQEELVTSHLHQKKLRSNMRRNALDVDASSRLGEPVIDPLFIVYDGKLDPNTRYSGFIEIMVVGPNGQELKRRSPMFVPIRTRANDTYASVLPTALGVVCGLVAVILVLVAALCILRRKGGPVSVPILPQPNIKPIKKENLALTYVERHRDCDLLFQREYELLPEFFKDRTTKASDSIENFYKNRYPDIKAYDQTRVKLSTTGGIPCSDYINANYVQGYKNRRKFICAQGPLDKTVNDFWRMIWEHKVGLIAMVTGLEENGKIKCSKYWPDEGENVYGDISVSLINEMIHGEYAVRRFSVRTLQSSDTDNINNIGPLKVTQFHYLVWKDFLAPDHPGGILKFIKRIREAYNPSVNYILVHCSAGVGRTGTLVAIDSLLEQMEEEGQVDVFHFVSSIRKYRNFLVQSLTQYIFIYRALLEYAQFNDTEINSSCLSSRILELESSIDGEKSLLSKEFEKLDYVIEDYKSTDIGSMDVNRNKNRNDFIIPFDYNRVVLAPFDVLEMNTYINASIIQGYDRSACYIITQDPLEYTMGDFWRMIHEHCIYIIVMLSSMENEGGFVKYWPDDHQNYDYISVTCTDYEKFAHYTIRKFTVTNTKSSQTHVVTHFQFHDWNEHGGVPETTSELLCLIEHVHSTHNEAVKKEPFVVHCSGGGDRSSVFVALSILVQQVSSEGRVDVFHVVCNLRAQRKFMIQSLEQYRFCYRAILDFIELKELG